MENNKQTAVEYLEKAIDKYVAYIEGYHNAKIFTSSNLYLVIRQAKQMEKQQKMECWETAHQAGRFEGKGIAEENWQTFQQYYNEEYGGNK